MTATSRFFDTYAAYRSALLEGLALASRTLVLFDPDLRATRLESSAGIAALERFLGEATAEDSARLLIHSPDFAERECPRLLELLLRFEHRARIRVTTAAFRSWTQPFLVVDRMHLVTRFHQDAARGKICLDDGPSAAIRFAQFETMWVSAQPGPSCAPLGI